MKYSIRFRLEIPDDIAEACAWYERRSRGLSLRFLRELEAAFDRITASPLSFAAGERDVRSARLHRFPYVVHFRFVEQNVVVLAVMYGGRDPTAWQNRV